MNEERRSNRITDTTTTIVEEGSDFLESMNIEDVNEGSKVSYKMMSKGGKEVLGELPVDGSKGDERYKDVRIPSKPADWHPPDRKVANREPKFEDVDNPGQWDEYFFRPKFAGKGKNAKYKGHFLPTGATPVKKDDDGKRTVGDWEFYYRGFENNEKKYRRGATTSNLFPEEMKGSLDADMLKKLGLTADKVKNLDALFFFQLILPLCDTKKSGIDGDPRMSYYTDVEKYTNVYMCLQGQSYGHNCPNTTAMELLHFDAILIYDGVLGGSNGALYKRWEKGGCMYQKDIAKTMTLTRFWQLKSNQKLCINEGSKKRGEDGYDPAYKFDKLYKSMVHNVNAITKKADEDAVVDESTWGHAGYGESGTGVTGRLRNKKVSKGGQVVITTDRSRLRPRAYIHRTRIYNELFKDEKTG